MRTLGNILFVTLLTYRLFSAEPLYSRHGTDPSFAAVLESGGIKPGERFSPGPVPGSRVDVNNEALEKQVGKPGPIVTKGSFTKGKDNQIGFRWGMDCGSKKGDYVTKDALLFVTGATLRVLTLDVLIRFVPTKRAQNGTSLNAKR